MEGRKLKGRPASELIDMGGVENWQEGSSI